MIASLRGAVLEKGGNDAIIDVNGVGYRVFFSLLTLTRLPEPGQTTQVRVRTVVREDALDLYGFLTAAEESLFLMLTGVSRVGPKLALTVLSGLETEALVGAIARGEVARLSKIHGVGKKTAERLVLELKDRAIELELGSKQTAASTTKAAAGVEGDVISALVNLGFKAPDADRGVKAAAALLEAPLSFEILFRESLKALRAGKS